MKLFSVILPANSIWRYLVKGRRAIGFVGGVLAIRNFGGDPIGVNVPTADDVATHTGATATITKKVNLCTYAAGTVTANFPLVDGDLREVIIIKQGANGVTATKASADAANIIVSGAGSASTATVATASQARFLSDGTYWYRVS